MLNFCQQMQMFDQEIQMPERGTRSYEEWFHEFHKVNPHIFEELKTMAFALKMRGHEYYSIKGLFEVLRFRRATQTEGDLFKLNNNLTSRYARLLMGSVPELNGFFRTRELKTA